MPAGFSLFPNPMTTAAAPAPANAFDNPEFRKEFRNTLDSALQPMVKTVGEHEDKIEALEARDQRSRGAIWVLRVLFGAVVVAAEYLLHRGAH